MAIGKRFPSWSGRLRNMRRNVNVCQICSIYSKALNLSSLKYNCQMLNQIYTGLHLTAQSECRIASQSSRRPTTSSSLSTTGLPQLIPSLLTAADNEKAFHEDAFQARVCLGWLHWTINEPSLAVSRLPAAFAQVFDRLTREGATLTRWTHVCIVKGAYIRGQ
jgi:hypothetical protein